jgi:hypothetical protein
MASRTKFLVRTWLFDRGCCHLRSLEMSDTEARGLLDAAHVAILKAQESGGIEEVPATKGRAFVMARRSPDPNQPGRTAPGFALVSISDPEAFLLDAVAALLRSVDAIEGSDTILEGWEFLDPGSTHVKPGGGSGQESRTARRVGVASHPSRYWRVSPGIVRLARNLLGAFRYITRSNHPSSGVDSLRPRSGKSGEFPAAKEVEWIRDREKIDELLQDPRAVRILDKFPHRGSSVPDKAKDQDDR